MGNTYQWILARNQKMIRARKHAAWNDAIVHVKLNTTYNYSRNNDHSITVWPIAWYETQTGKKGTELPFLAMEYARFQGVVNIVYNNMWSQYYGEASTIALTTTKTAVRT